jgi:hypothetical protein
MVKTFKVLLYDEIRKFNPYHGPDGRFTGPGGAASFTYKPGQGRMYDLAIEREKKRTSGGSSGGGKSVGPDGGYKDGKCTAKTVEEAREYAKQKLGFDQVDYSYSYIDQKEGRQVTGTFDIDTINSVNATITQIHERYPEMAGYLKVMETYDSNACAAVVHTSGDSKPPTLKLGAKHYSQGLEKMSEIKRRDAESGFHPKNCNTAESTIWHEYGHVYGAMQNRKQTFENYGVPKDAPDFQKIGNHLFEQVVRQNAAEKLYQSGSFKNSYGMERPHLLAKKVSKYAQKNASETFAEAFASYNMDPKVRNKFIQALMEESGVKKRYP